MDDWVVLAPTRWALRRAIKATNQVMAELKVEKHPDKTCIGRVGRGFDFLGYRFAPGELAVARVTVERFIERVSRLYEQNATASRIEEYARRWLIWVRSGVQRVELLQEGEGAKDFLSTYTSFPLSTASPIEECDRLWFHIVRKKVMHSF
ncbi:MAG: hypothetical protein F6K48_17055 [Okeania sp. SIO3H1]|nr:hypothetical protein [Okeania sp. SIO3H1]